MHPALPFVIKSTIILTGALLLVRLLAGVNPRWRMWLCEYTLAATILLPAISWLPLSIPLSLHERGANAERRVSPSSGTSRHATEVNHHGDILGDHETLGTPPAGLRHMAAPVTGHQPLRHLTVDYLLALVYGLGVCIFALRYWVGARRLRKSLENLDPPDGRSQAVFERLGAEFNLKTTPALRVAEGEISPFCVESGRKEIIVIPAWLTEEEHFEALSLVLRHEVHHLANEDLRRSKFMIASAVLLWFHPFVWLIRRSHALATEELSDRVASGGEARRERYRSMLAKLTRRLHEVRSHPSMVWGLFRTPEIVVRLRRLGRTVPYGRLSPLSQLTVGMVIGLPVLLAVGLVEVAAAVDEKISRKRAWVEVAIPESERGAVESSIRSALSTLLAAQAEDGSFSARSRGPGEGHETGTTALAGMTFLAHGGAEENSPYHAAMLRCLDYVSSCQAASGVFKASRDGSTGSMYHHFIATWFLASALEHTGDESRKRRIEGMLRNAVKHIVDAQAVPKSVENRGGWRYSPGSKDSDLSCTAWAIRALYAAKRAGIDVPGQVLDDAVNYVLRLQNPDGGFAYVLGQGRSLSNVPRTGMGLYTLQKAGKADTREAARAAAYLHEECREPQSHYEFYGVLWSASAMFQRGGGDALRHVAWMVDYCGARQLDGRWNSRLGDILGTVFVLLAYAPPD